MLVLIVAFASFRLAGKVEKLGLFKKNQQQKQQSTTSKICDQIKVFMPPNCLF